MPMIAPDFFANPLLGVQHNPAAIPHGNISLTNFCACVTGSSFSHLSFADLHCLLWSLNMKVQANCLKGAWKLCKVCWKYSLPVKVVRNDKKRPSISLPLCISSEPAGYINVFVGCTHFAKDLLRTTCKWHGDQTLWGALSCYHSVYRVILEKAYLIDWFLLKDILI